jgi:ankyrin repeat protein
MLRLLQYGADPKLENVSGNILLKVVSEGKLAMVDILLDDLDPNTLCEDGTLLHRAVVMEDEELVLVLLHDGADRTIVNKDGLTPYQLAKEKGYKDIRGILKYN